MVATQMPEMTGSQRNTGEDMSEFAGPDTVEFEPGQKELYRINNAMIRMHLPLVKNITTAVARSCSIKVAYDDLVSAGVYGLIEAITQYQPDCRIAFEDFCKPRIKAALLDAIRYAMWTVGQS